MYENKTKKHLKRTIDSGRHHNKMVVYMFVGNVLQLGMCAYYTDKNAPS